MQAAVKSAKGGLREATMQRLAVGKAAPTQHAVTLLYTCFAHQTNGTTQNRPHLFTTVLPDVKQVSPAPAPGLRARTQPAQVMTWLQPQTCSMRPPPPPCLPLPAASALSTPCVATPSLDLRLMPSCRRPLLTYVLHPWAPPTDMPHCAVGPHTELWVTPSFSISRTRLGPGSVRDSCRQPGMQWPPKPLGTHRGQGRAQRSTLLQPSLENSSARPPGPGGVCLGF